MEQRSFARRHRHLGKISLQAFLWQVVNLLSSLLSPPLLACSVRPPHMLTKANILGQYFYKVLRSI